MKKITDHIGIIISCTCIIHCLLLPFILILLNLNIEHEWFHTVLLFLTVGVSGHALYHGYKKHCKHIVLFLGIIGVGCMGIALVGSEWFETIMTSIGAIIIIGAHIINLKENKCCGEY